MRDIIENTNTEFSEERMTLGVEISYELARAYFILGHNDLSLNCLDAFANYTEYQKIIER